jgi:orotate phosphoribosyltransferase
MGNQIEGYMEPGKKVVVIEDLISTGKSSLQVVDVLRENGANVIGMCGLFTYGFNAASEAFEKAGLPLYTISNYTALMEVAEEQKLVEPGQKETLEQWRVDPANWGK